MRNSSSILPWLALLLAITLEAQVAVAQSPLADAGVKTWNGTASKDWLNPTNWTPAGVPAPTDTVVLDNNSEVTFSAPVVHNGPFRWVAGRLTATPYPLTLGPAATLTLLPGNYKIIAGAVTNAGTVRLAGGAELYLDNLPFALFVNLPGAVVESTGGDAILCGNNCGGIFENRGLFRKTDGANTVSSSQILFTNSGTVAVFTNALEIQNGAHADAGFQGPGTTVLSGRQLFRGEISATNVQLQAGPVSVDQARLHGSLTWVTGVLTNSGLTVAGDGVLTLVPGNYKIVATHLTNAGVIRYSGGAELYLDNTLDARLVNLPAALIDSTGADALLCATVCGGVVENRGTLRKSGGADLILPNSLLFLNSGTIDIQTNAVEIRNGQHRDAAFTGPGEARFGNLNTWRGTISATHATLKDGFLNADGATLDGHLTWITGSLTTSSNAPGCNISSNSVVTLVPGNYKTLSGYLTNAGTVRLQQDTALFLDNNPYALFVNQPGALLESGGADVFDCVNTCGGVFENRGRITKTGGSDTVFGAGILLTNRGSVTVATNAVEIRRGAHVGGTYSGAVRLVNVNSLAGEIDGSNLLFASGLLTADGATFRGQLTWTTGTLLTTSNAPGFTVATNGSLLLLPGNYKVLNGHLTNGGTVRLLQGSEFYLDNAPDSRLINLPGGVVDSAGADLFNCANNCGGVIENRGTFLKSAGADTVINSLLFFTNSATVEVRTNAFEVRWGWHAGVRALGPGIFKLTGSNSLRGDVNMDHLLFPSGALDAGGSRFHGQAEWITGTIGAGLGSGPGWSIADDGLLTLSPGNYKFFYGTISNAGTIRLTGDTALYFYYNDHSTLLNLPGGLVQSSGNDLFQSDGTPNRSFENQGVFRKDVGGDTILQSNVMFTNRATVDVTGHSLEIRSGWHLGSAYTGTGDVRLANTNVFQGPVTGAHLAFTGGYLDAGDALLHGNLTWSAGGLRTATNTAFTLAPDATLTLIPGANKILSGLLTNAGTLRFSNSSTLYFFFSPVCRLVNQPGALIESTGDDLFAGDGAENRTLENHGLLRRIDVPGSTTIGGNITLANDGPLEIRRGTLQVNGAYTGVASEIRLGLPDTTSYGRVSVFGPVTLGGNLVLLLPAAPSFAATNVFHIFTTSRRTGTFATVSGNSLGGGLFLVTTNLPTGVDLLVQSGGQGPTLAGLGLNGGQAGFQFLSQTGALYTVEFNDDLTTTQWVVRGEIVGDGTFKTFQEPATNRPARFFRLRQH